MKQHFVDPFSTSSTRAGIYEWWLDHRLALAEIIDVRVQWVGGSFVSGKVDPGDIDITTVFDGEKFDALPKHRRLMADSLMSGPYTRQFWRCDSYRLPEYPPTHPAHAAFLSAQAYWQAHWGTTRANAPRGYLEVT